ncbi:MAG: RecX family transcriptional regulator [Acutalibacteraceae bacterium]|nr:RecX family transcriptional regulator [Acutalibacteraceae bacterium]
MKITKMLRRRGHIYEVRFDDDTYINVDISLADGKNLCEGQEISEEQAFALEDESEQLRCTSRALYYLSRSDKSEKGLYKKLVTAGFEERFVKNTVSRMKELSYIDDSSFALRLYEKCSAECLSNKGALNKLVEAGISYAVAKEICVYDCESEQEKIKKLVNKKYSSKLSDKEGIRKTAEALYRRGFVFSDIRAVLKEYDQTIGE